MKRQWIIFGMSLLLAGPAWSAPTKPGTAEPKKVWKMTLPDLMASPGEGNTVAKDIEILSFSHGFTLDLDPAKGIKDPAKAKLLHHDISIVKNMDAYSPLLMKALTARQVLKNVSLEIKGPTATIRMDLENVYIASVRPGGSAYASEDLPLEEVSFIYKTAKISYIDAQTKSSAVLTP